MKLGVKMFFCITIFFSAAFLSCGVALISYFYETAVQKEIESTSQQYQYNKFVIQAALITREDTWMTDPVTGFPNIDFLISDMNGMAALFTSDDTLLFSGFPAETDFSDLLRYKYSEKVNYRFMEIKDRMHLLIFGSFREKNTSVFLITGIDAQNLLQQHKQIIQKFGYIYAGAISIGILLIFVLSALLTRPVKRLTAATKKIASGNYTERVAVTGNDEVSQLAQNFNQMACAIEEKIEALSEAARQKEEFAASFAHELKTPLTSVIGYADRIYQKELPREAQKQAAWHIWNEGMRLEALSMKLMDLTVFQHKDFILQEMDASQLLEELAADLEYLIMEKNITFSCQAQPSYVNADYDLFKTLFLNLIDNAVKADASKIRVTGTRKNVSDQASRYLIQVEDNGCGIPPDEIKKITEAFYMVDKSRSRKLHGAGLGLCLAQKIAKIHGADLTFHSDGQNGTTVIICLATTDTDN